jgi:hypothetical protein
LANFQLVREQAGVSGGPPRLEILSDVPNNFWLVTIMQGRWLSSEVESWFPPVVKQDKIKLISRP